MTSSNDVASSYAAAAAAAVPSDDDVSAAFEDALDDVHTRFLLNLPPEELETSDRIFFQLEQAYWFYDDFHCDNSELPLPRFKSLKPFALKMFQISPMLDVKLFDQMWEEFSAYKRQISTYGTILLNSSCTKMILCQAWKSNSWTFPAGKVNQHESGTDAGARETFEETGFDPNCCFGLAKRMHERGEHITWNPLQEDDALVFLDAGKRRTMYVCRGVPEDFPFEPVARKEVSAVEWHNVDEVPKRSFAVLPFMKQLRRWIKKNGKAGKKKDKFGTPGRKRPTSNKKSRSQNSSRGRVREDDPLTEAGLASLGDINGWAEEDMFKANEKLLGRKITYDGNPHHFAEKGFDGRDPHAFHVVGGSFMNSGGISSLASPPEQSRLQPLFRKEGMDDLELQPFFSAEGETPWGDRMPEAAGLSPAREKIEGDDKFQRNDRGGKGAAPCGGKPQVNAGGSVCMVMSNDLEAVFLTDAEITDRSQRVKGIGKKDNARESREAARDKKRDNFAAIQMWIEQLKRQSGTQPHDFRFNQKRLLEVLEAHPVG
jgi:mRNA-decapping enzyme subunit 2